MKVFIKGVLLFLVGFALMGSAHLLTRCESFDRIINPPDIVDDTGVKNAAVNIENAFLQGDTEKIKSLMMEESVGFYGGILDSASTEQLLAFGEAFKTRELDVISDIYAEYHFTVDERDFSVAFAWQNEDKWVLTRF